MSFLYNIVVDDWLERFGFLKKLFLKYFGMEKNWEDSCIVVIYKFLKNDKINSLNFSYFFSLLS